MPVNPEVMKLNYCWKGIEFKPEAEMYCLMKNAKPGKDLDGKLKCFENSCPGANDAGPYCLKSGIQLPKNWVRKDAIV